VLNACRTATILPWQHDKEPLFLHWRNSPSLEPVWNRSYHSKNELTTLQKCYWIQGKKSVLYFGDSWSSKFECSKPEGCTSVGQVAQIMLEFGPDLGLVKITAISICQAFLSHSFFL
jgi:hypothetical protein